MEQILVKIGVNSPQLSSKLDLVKGVEGVRVDVQVLQPRHQLMARQRHQLLLYLCPIAVDHWHHRLVHLKSCDINSILHLGKDRRLARVLQLHLLLHGQLSSVQS